MQIYKPWPTKNLSKKLIPATMVGSAVIHYNNLANTYESAMRCIAKKCNLENKGEIYIITYGEPASIAAWLKSFISKDSLLRCTRHFETNCKDLLISLGISGNMKDAMLDAVFSEHELVEAQNTQD